MIYRLEQPDYPKVRSIFTELSAYNAALPALLDGINPGWVLADSRDNPRSALACTVEGHFLAGDSSNDAFVKAANTYLVENYFNDEPTVDGGAIYLRIHPKSWKDRVSALFHPRQPMTLRGRHYLCTNLKYTDWRKRIPDGFSVRRIDDDLLDSADIDIPDHIIGWIDWNWGTRENYRQRGFGFGTLHGPTVVSWSVADCATQDGHCEIGIRTRPAYRRQGLAAITAAAAVDYALSNGFVQVGWQCLDDNVGSYKTAEKVGFVHERTDASYYCMFSRLHQLAELGWYHCREGRLEQSVDAYQQLFSLGHDYPDYVYHTAARAFAALNDHEQAIRWLNVAIDRGWTHVNYTLNECLEFATLRGTPEWEKTLARMRQQEEDQT